MSVEVSKFHGSVFSFYHSWKIEQQEKIVDNLEKFVKKL